MDNEDKFIFYLFINQTAALLEEEKEAEDVIHAPR